MRTGGIGIRYALITVAHRMDGDAMYLVEPVESAGDPRHLLQSGAVGLDPGQCIAHMGPEVQTSKDPSLMPPSRVVERALTLPGAGQSGAIQFICGSFRSYENGAPWLQPVKGPRIRSWRAGYGRNRRKAASGISSRQDRPDWPGYPPAALPSAPPYPAAWGVPLHHFTRDGVRQLQHGGVQCLTVKTAQGLGQFGGGVAQQTQTTAVGGIPTSGCLMWAMWTRIWWVRPVSSRNRRRCDHGTSRAPGSG